MEVPKLEALPEGVLDTLRIIEAMSGTTFFPFSLPTAATGAAAGTVWSKAAAPSAAAGATALGTTARVRAHCKGLGSYLCRYGYCYYKSHGHCSSREPLPQPRPEYITLEDRPR